MDAARREAEQILGGPLVVQIKRRRRISQDDRLRRVAQMALLYGDKGWSLERVGQAFGMSRERIRQLFAEYGIETRPVRGADAYRRAIGRRRAEHGRDADGANAGNADPDSGGAERGADRGAAV